MLDLSTKSIIFISLLSLNELFLMMTGLKRTLSILLLIPAGFIIVYYWSYFLQNRIVLTFLMPVAVYVLLAMVYSTLSGNIDFSLIPGIILSSVLAASISIHIIRSDNEIVGNVVAFSRNILIVSSAAIVLSPWYYPYLPELQPHHIQGHRFSGFFTNPNDASFAAIALLNFVLYRPFDRKTVTALAVILATFAVFYTLSKTGIIMYFTSLGVFMFFKRKWLAFSVLSIFLSSVPYLVNILTQIGFALPLDDERVDRINDMVRFFYGYMEDNIGDKDILWYDAIQRIKYDFPHGAGLGTFHRLVDSVYVESIDDWYGVHNMYLMVFGEAGFVAFAVFVGCYGGLIILALFYSKDKLAFAIILVSLLYFGTVHHAFEIRSQMVILAFAVGLLGHNMTKSIRR